MAISAPLYSATGKSLGNKALPAAVFQVPVNEPLIAQALKVYSSNQRQNTKKVKTRAEVAYTTQKMWRQKGTGRARHGSRRAPIFVGGGVAHGPTGLERTKLHLSQKMRLASLHSALSLHAQNHTLILVEDLATVKFKTQAARKLLLTVTESKSLPKTLIILDQPNQALIQSVRNLSQITTTQAKRLNIYEVMNHRCLVLTLKSVELLSPKV